MLAKGSLPSGQWSGTSPFCGFAVCQKNSNVRCSMSSSDGAAALVIAAACGTAPVAAGAGSLMDAAAAGASLADVLTDAAVAGPAVVVLAAGGAIGAAGVAYRECSAGPIPTSSTHSSAMPARHSVREPANRAGFFDEPGAPCVMAHDRRRGARTGPARQCLCASNGGPGMRPPL